MIWYYHHGLSMSLLSRATLSERRSAHFTLRGFEGCHDHGTDALNAAMLFVLLVIVAKATTPTLEEGALHRLLIFEVHVAIPHELDSTGATASRDAGDRFAAARVAELLVNLRGGARTAKVVEETKRALWLKEAGLPFTLRESSCHGCV